MIEILLFIFFINLLVCFVINSTCGEEKSSENLEDSPITDIKTETIENIKKMLITMNNDILRINEKLTELENKHKEKQEEKDKSETLNINTGTSNNNVSEILRVAIGQNQQQKPVINNGNNSNSLPTNVQNGKQPMSTTNTNKPIQPLNSPISNNQNKPIPLQTNTQQQKPVKINSNNSISLPTNIQNPKQSMSTTNTNKPIQPLNLPIPNNRNIFNSLQINTKQQKPSINLFNSLPTNFRNPNPPISTANPNKPIQPLNLNISNNQNKSNPVETNTQQQKQVPNPKPIPLNLANPPKISIPLQNTTNAKSMKTPEITNSMNNQTNSKSTIPTDPNKSNITKPVKPSEIKPLNQPPPKIPINPILNKITAIKNEKENTEEKINSKPVDESTTLKSMKELGSVNLPQQSTKTEENKIENKVNEMKTEETKENKIEKKDNKLLKQYLLSNEDLMILMKFKSFIGNPKMIDNYKESTEEIQTQLSKELPQEISDMINDIFTTKSTKRDDIIDQIEEIFDLHPQLEW